MNTATLAPPACLALLGAGCARPAATRAPQAGGGVARVGDTTGWYATRDGRLAVLVLADARASASGGSGGGPATRGQLRLEPDGQPLSIDGAF